MSLRERKKEQTRQTIAETAHRLFAERGFEDVTVAEVARAADVSEGTVFNYFPTKEDLFYDQMEAFEGELIQAVRARKPGESVLRAFRRIMLQRARGLDTKERAEIVAKAARIIAASPALQARQREIVERATHTLAALIAEETNADEVESWVAANALMGVQRGLQHYLHTQVVAGRSGPALAADVRSRARRAFARLERGLGDYGIRR